VSSASVLPRPPPRSRRPRRPDPSLRAGPYACLLAASLSLAGLAFATWLEDAGIPARVIDALMGHQGGRRGERDSPMAMAYRHTTPQMQACVVAVIEACLAIAIGVVLQLSPKRPQPPQPQSLARSKGRLTCRVWWSS
jgi:hypothetical protein